MVIGLREDYFKGSHVSWKQVNNLGLLEGKQNLKRITGKKATQVSPSLQEINSFSQLITKLRHAFAHNCYTLIIDKNSSQITVITAWIVKSGQDNKPKNRIWEVDLLENELKELAYLIVEYIENELGQR